MNKRIFQGKKISDLAILITLTIIYSLFESILVLLSIFRKGVIKKEVLSENSDFGFDFKIIMK